MERASRKEALAEFFDSTDEHSGYSIRTARRPRKVKVPSWAGSKHDIDDHIMGPARRRAKIAYWYWLVGWTAAEVANELMISENAVKMVLRKLRGSKQTL